MEISRKKDEILLIPESRILSPRRGTVAEMLQKQTFQKNNTWYTVSIISICGRM